MRNQQRKRKSPDPPDPIEELIRILDEEQECAPGDRVVATYDGTRLTIMRDVSKGGLLLWSLILLMVLGPPAAMLIFEPITLKSMGGAALFVMVLGGSFLRLSMGEVASRINTGDGTIQVRSVNPVLRLIRDRFGLGLRYPWERGYTLTEMEAIRVERKHISRRNRVYRIGFLTRGGKSVPIADLNEERFASRVAGLLSMITGVPR